MKISKFYAFISIGRNLCIGRNALKQAGMAGSGRNELEFGPMWYKRVIHFSLRTGMKFSNQNGTVLITMLGSIVFFFLEDR